jgi:tetratricopeptide (TPR) repeat protein
LDQKNPLEALRFAEEILQVLPQDPKARLYRATSFIASSRYPEARNELRGLLREHPQYREAQFQTGLLDIQEKKFQEAEGIFRTLGVDESNGARPAVGLAGAYISQKQYDRAIQLLTEQSKGADTPVGILNLLALTAVQAGRYPLAVQTFQRVLTANPNSVDAYINLAEAYRLSGNPTAVPPLLQKAKELAPKNPATIMLLSSAFYSAGMLPQSTELLRGLVQTQPGNATVLNNLAFLITEAGGDLNEAERFARLAVQKDANVLNNQDTLGWVYYKRNMTDSAVRIFANLVQRDGENPTYRYHHGAALLKQGATETAVSELRAALAKKPQPDQERAIRDLLSMVK